MGIIVKLSDATVEVGGEFSSTLAFVKGLPSRRYNSADKTNSVTMTLAEFARSCGRPYDVRSAAQTHRSGEHVTRWGTRYSRNEWDAKNEIAAAEKQIAQEFQPRYDALKAELRQRSTAIGLDARAVAMIERAGELEMMIEAGRVQFRTDARRREVLALNDWYASAWNAIYEEEQDRAGDAAKQILEANGIY